MNGKKVEELEKTLRDKFPNVELNFEVIDNWLTVKPNGFLGAEIFAPLSAAVKELGGEWVSLAKLGHFRFQIASVTAQSLRDWYAQQRRMSEPLLLPLNLNFQVVITSPDQLGKYLEEIKKHVGPAEVT